MLRPRRVRSGLAAINQAATVEYQPLGVVGVIGPWNYPVFTPIGSIAYALAAGTAVVFKPSELTPAPGDWLVRAFGEALEIFGDVRPVLQLITGPGSTGEALARSGVPKAITRQRMRPPVNLTSFGRTDQDMRRIVTLVTLLHGRLYRPRGGGRRRR